MRKIKREVRYIVSVGMIFGILTLAAWLKPAEEISYTERRRLAEFPEISVTSLWNGRFMSKLETYLTDQFPLRDEFRTWKALFSKYAFGQKDQDGIYVQEGIISKIEYPYNENGGRNACQKYRRIYENYMKNTEVNIYTALIPDKHYFIGADSGYPVMDYSRLYEEYQSSMGAFAQYVEIAEHLTIQDYYRTDTHWKQEEIQDVAEALAEQMGVHLSCVYDKVTLDTPFYGVYYGQTGLPVEADQISYMNQSIFEKCKVYDYQNQKELSVYDITKAEGRDAYELFLGGSLSVITVENPEATTEKELVIFRDSFGSSIAPYFIEGYQKITLLDVRYLQEILIPDYVSFEDQDVLILHSTSVINNESAFQ